MQDVYMRNTLIAFSALLPTAALAHPGHHDGMDWRSLAAHLLEWDHLGIAALVGIAFWLGIRHLRARKNGREA